MIVFPPNSKPYGKTFAEWSAEWIKWALTIPIRCNPAADTTGKNCAINQSGPVWFLAGTFGGSVKRKCSLPAGKAILFPVVLKECSFTEDLDLATESELRARTKEAIDNVSIMEVSVDGLNIPNLKQYRAQSPLFSFTFPSNNVYGVKAGPTQAVSDGFWILLKPLPAGHHEIHFAAEVSLSESSKLLELVKQYNKITGKSFVTEVFYDLMVD
jgi:hypothetical protein